MLRPRSTQRLRRFVCFASLLAMLLPLYACSPQTQIEEANNSNLQVAITQAARQNIPAVVNIEVTGREKVTNPLFPFENDPFLRHFFNFPQVPRDLERIQQRLGSGMILDERGYVLTNHHVVRNASKISVLLADGRRLSAKLIGADPYTDLAVIRISTANNMLQRITFGDSDKIEVGQWVVAIGAPQGLDQTVTKGIISAKHRRGILSPQSYQDFLQTDAAINPGNSGGPLLNLYGEVVGINVAIMSESGGFEGIGFAIPSNMAAHVAKELIAEGQIEQSWLGKFIGRMSYYFQGPSDEKH